MAEAQFSLLSGLTFAFVGLAVFVALAFKIYIVTRIVKHFYYRHKLEKARQEIEARVRKNLHRMIQVKDNEEFWLGFRANLENRDRY